MNPAWHMQVLSTTVCIHKLTEIFTISFTASFLIIKASRELRSRDL